MLRSSASAATEPHHKNTASSTSTYGSVQSRNFTTDKALHSLFHPRYQNYAYMNNCVLHVEYTHVFPYRKHNPEVPRHGLTSGILTLSANGKRTVKLGREMIYVVASRTVARVPTLARHPLRKIEK